MVVMRSPSDWAGPVDRRGHHRGGGRLLADLTWACGRLEDLRAIKRGRGRRADSGSLAPSGGCQPPCWPRAPRRGRTAPRRPAPAPRARRRRSRRCCRASRRCRTSPPCRPTAGSTRRRRPGAGAGHGQHLDSPTATEEAGVVAAEEPLGSPSSRSPASTSPTTLNACATAARNGGNGCPTAVASTSAGTGAPRGGTPACRGTTAPAGPTTVVRRCRARVSCPIRSASASSRSTARSHRHQPRGTSEPVCRSRSARSSAAVMTASASGARPRWCRPVASWNRAEISCSGEAAASSASSARATRSTEWVGDHTAMLRAARQSRSTSASPLSRASRSDSAPAWSPRSESIPT